MIDPKELRIGNYVSVPSDRHDSERLERKVMSIRTGIDQHIGTFFIQECAYVNLNIKIVNPIPLTEEWLIKFGFEKIDTGYISDQYTGYTWILWSTSFELEIYRDGLFYFDKNDHNLKFEYVHHLQNAYFYLIGEELKIK